MSERAMAGGIIRIAGAESKVAASPREITPMHSTLIAVTAASLLAGTSTATAQTPDTTNAVSAPAVRQSTEPTVPLERLIALVAKKTGKMFVLDPRVHGDVVLIGRSPTEISYTDLLGILEVYGYVAIEAPGSVRVVPDANVRVEPIPTITPKDTRPGPEYVTEIITLKNIATAFLVPILRPMVPQNGQLVAYPQTNSLIIVDRFENVRRIEALVRALDTEGAGKPRVDGTTPNNSKEQ